MVERKIGARDRGARGSCVADPAINERLTQLQRSPGEDSSELLNKAGRCYRAWVVHFGALNVVGSVRRNGHGDESQIVIGVGDLSTRINSFESERSISNLGTAAHQHPSNHSWADVPVIDRPLCPGCRARA